MRGYQQTNPSNRNTVKQMKKCSPSLIFKKCRFKNDMPVFTPRNSKDDEDEQDSCWGGD